MHLTDRRVDALAQARRVRRVRRGRALVSNLPRPRFEGSTRILDRGPRKADVQKQGRERARKHKVEHIIQKQDGTIGERNSYGGDSPRRPG